MCRFLAYSGKAILMHDLLYGPKNSLIKQSISANEAEEPLNGDGFGIGWYDHQFGHDPALYTSIKPAWNDRNLTSMSKKIFSNCFFAHVRAATTGHVTEFNCHPFQYKNFLFMHNGGLEDFHLIKRSIRQKLNDEIYNWLSGQTDSEHFFALFMQNLFHKYHENPNLDQMVEVMKQTIEEIVEIKNNLGLTSNNYINMTVTDGKNIVGLRYVTQTDYKASTLYYSEGSYYECREGICRMHSPNEIDEKTVLIVSEKLTSVKNDWIEIPKNHFITVDSDKNVKVIDYNQVSFHHHKTKLKSA